MNIYVPKETGVAALMEVHKVPWDDLEHAYGTGIGKGAHENVPAALQLLGGTDEASLDEAVHLLFGNVCHQGTIYESTAYAFPFIAAWGAGAEPSDDIESAIVQLLACIAIASTFEAPHGSHAGSFGPAVSAATKSAIAASAVHLNVIATRSPRLKRLVSALLPAVNAPELKTLLDA